MKKMALALMAFSFSSAFANAPVAPNFRLFLAKDAAIALVPSAPSVRRSKIAEHLAGRLLSGVAYTNGRTHIELVPSEQDARIRLVLDFTTSARTINEVKPRPDITVDVYATAITETHVTKVIIFKPDHLETLPAEAESQTAVTIHGASARTKGAFAGEKKRQAEAQAIAIARESVPGKEAQTSARVHDEILTQVESKADPMLKDLNRDYKAIFYDPLFTDNRIPGSPHYYSAADGFRVVVEPPSPTDGEPIALLPVLHPNTIVGMNLHQSLLNQKLSPHLAGKVYDEYELEVFLIRQGMVSTPHAWGGVAERTYIRFCDRDPMHFELANNTADVRVCLKGVRLPDGAWEGGATMHMSYQLEKPRGDSVILRRGPIEVKAEGAPISAATLSRFEERYSKIFPATQEVGALPIPTSASILQDLVLEHAAIENGWITLEWRDGNN